MNLLKKIFGAIFGLLAGIGKLLGLGKKGEFYLEIEPTTPAPEPTAPVATTVPEPEPAAETPSAAPVATVSAAPVAPPVTAPDPVSSEPAPAPAPAVPYAQFARRRPGANMASFLTMARQVRPSA